MIIRRLHPEQYEQICRYLNQQGKSGAFDASYEVTITVDDCEYVLRLQPCGKCKLAALQAVQVCRGETERQFRLITENLPLSSLLELFLFQQKNAQANRSLA